MGNKTNCILVINCGSSSLKYEVFAMPEQKSLGKGLVERIGETNGHLEQSSEKGEIEKNQPIPTHTEAVQLMVEAMTDGSKGLVKDKSDITGVGHRVVHGGEMYSESVVIDDKVLKAIEACIELAPLHNPANLIGIQQAQAFFPGVTQVAVFDTAFHQTLSPSAYLYGLPRELYDKYKIRRYGFHGTSHRYVAHAAAEFMKRSPDNTNLIVCHLGNGASICAISAGKSVDTSMGFTPLEGLVMGTRSGDIDPAILFYLMDRGYTDKQLNTMLNKESGVLGLSTISNDLRDVEAAAANGDNNAIEALDVYAHRIRHYIGAYHASLVRTDIIAFTGGVGQHGAKMREMICDRLENLGIVIDRRKNMENGSKPGIISKEYSPTAIVVMPTNEELQIAMDTSELL